MHQQNSLSLLDRRRSSSSLGHSETSSRRRDVGIGTLTDSTGNLVIEFLADIALQNRIEHCIQPFLINAHTSRMTGPLGIPWPLLTDSYKATHFELYPEEAQQVRCPIMLCTQENAHLAITSSSRRMASLEVLTRRTLWTTEFSFMGCVTLWKITLPCVGLRRVCALYRPVAVC